MSESSCFRFFAFIYVFVFVIGFSSTEYVPVYMWETTQFSEIVPALERVSQDSFRKIIADRTTKRTPILVFAEENLSPEDYSLHDSDGRSPFSHLAKVGSSAQVSYWSSVKNPIRAIREIDEKIKVETSSKTILDDPNFTIRDNDILIVDLKDAKEGEDRLEMLKRHDRNILAIDERIRKQHKNVITLLTAYHPSWIISEELKSHRQTRETHAAPEVKADDDKYIIYNTTDLLIYMSAPGNVCSNGTIVSLDKFNKFEITNKNESYMEGVWSSDTSTEIKKIAFYFELAGGYWKVANITLNVKDQDYPLRVRDVYAPLGFSYHCNEQAFFHRDHSTINLTLPGLQMQVVVNSTAGLQKFGDAYNCVGFMTAPIWSGLFVTFILALIMTFGLTMMMDIKTMDRFDDPKGKTITISATE